MIVLDASAAVEWLLGFSLAGAVAERLADLDQTVHAPHLLAVEVAQVVRRYATAGEITEARGADALVDLADLDLVLHPHEPLLAAMWRLRSSLSAYDASYVTLAEALDAPVVTLDGALAGAPGHGARIDLIA